jgi:IS30 family transposase
MTKYTHLSLDEREKLYIMRKQGLAFADIGKKLGRNPSSLSREYRRNQELRFDVGYLPDTAHKLSICRKAKHGSKINRHPDLKNLIISLMRDERYSPEMIAGTLKLKKAKVMLSTETIYQFIYSKEGQEKKLYLYLMRSRPKRNQYYGRKTRSNYGIPDRVSISQRPKIKRRDFGHFEADLTFFKGSGKINLVTMVERKTGYFMADLNESKESENITIKLLHNLIQFPKKKRKTITFDNGKEFVMHNKIKEITGMPTYFCQPGSPWEKPYVEHTHSLLHRFIPKNTDAKTLTKEQVQNAIIKLNNLPRKRFRFKTPAQMLDNENLYQSDALRA